MHISIFTCVKVVLVPKGLIGVSLGDDLRVQAQDEVTYLFLTSKENRRNDSSSCSFSDWKCKP